MARTSTGATAWSRLMPQTIGGRVILTVVVLALLITVTTIAINAALITGQVDSWGRDGAAVITDGFWTYTTARIDNVRADVEESVDALTMRSAVRRSDVAALDAGLGRRAAVEAKAIAMAITDARGALLYSTGAPGEISELVRLAGDRTSEVRGLIALRSGPAIVVGAPVLSETGDATVGYLIAARLYGEDETESYNAIAGGAHLTLLPNDAPLPELDYRTASSREHAFRYVIADEALVTVVDMPSLGGGTAGLALISDADERTRRSVSAAWSASLLSGGAAVVLGLGLGAVLTYLIRQPVIGLVEHVQTRGYLAAEGAPYSAEDLAAEGAMPLEFRELSAVFEDLLRHLSTRQADLKEAIRKARAAEETLGIVVSESLEAKFVLQDGRVTLANPAASVLLGVPQSALMDCTLDEAFGRLRIRTEDGEETDPVGLLDRSMDTPTEVALSRDGQPDRWYIVQSARHTDDVHNRILITARDVTEERRLASIRSEIVSLISHDLRSPLAVVIGYLDLLRRPLSDEDRDRAIDSAKRSAGRMSDLLEDLLSATRAEELLAPSTLEPLSLAAIAEDVVASIAPTHSERPLLFEAPQSPIVLGEDRRLRQVLVNLVTNAFKYAEPPEPVVVRVSAADGVARLEVVDRGPGVPEHDRTRIFERFERLESGQSRPGLGLGLYIVRIISENHGGCVRVEQTPGGGATFVVELPLADDPLVPGTPPRVED